MDIDAGPILVRLQSQAPASVQPAFAQFSTLYDRKLWHELTLALDRLFRDPQGKSMIVPLYRELVLPLQKRLSPDSFVHFSVMAAEQLKGEEAIGLLLDIANQFKGDAKHVHLFVWARMSAALYQLAAGSLMETKEAIDQCQPLVDAFSGVDPLVKAAYFKVRSQYDKVKADFSAFYRDTFLFLACVKMEDLSVDEKTGLAHDLSVAALLGDTVYNFGELLMHPVLEAIQPDLSYLVATLSAFNCGDHGRFEQLLPTITKGSPILAGRLGFLRQKMCLMSLIEAVFAGLKESRRLGFAVIADRTHVPLGEVEFLLIKAMSLGLIKGRIDELAQVLVVDWVQPRVLDRKQMLELRSAIQSWKARIAGLSGDFDLWNTLPIAAAAMDE